jgi:hypothetical protein
LTRCSASSFSANSNSSVHGGAVVAERAGAGEPVGRQVGGGGVDPADAVDGKEADEQGQHQHAGEAQQQARADLEAGEQVHGVVLRQG